MICPLMLIGREISNRNSWEGAQDYNVSEECVNGCAWWDKKKGQCTILTLAQSSYSLKETIQNHLTKR